MEDLSTCPVCKFSRESLLEMPCCNSLFCGECLSSVAHCFKCKKVFDIKNCTPYSNLSVMVDNVIIECRHSGCDYKSTEFLIQQHESNCKFSTIYKSDLISILEPTQTPEYQVLQRRKNIFSNFMMYSNVRHVMDCIENDLSLDDTPLSTDVGSDGYYTHIILEGDTLSGLSIKYKVSASQIKEVNHLFHDRIHERTALKIPINHTPTFSERETMGLEELLKTRLVSRFRRKTSIKTTQEALYYLEEANMDIEKAFDAWAEDYSWEKNTKLEFKSCLPHEELELFKPQHKRGCCSLVF